MLRFNNDQVPPTITRYIDENPADYLLIYFDNVLN